MLAQGVWSFSCPNCGDWCFKPPRSAIIECFEIEQVFASGWGWIEKDFYEKELKPRGIPIKYLRKTIEWTVKLADGRVIKVTQNQLIEWWKALANPTTSNVCPFCGQILEKRWIRHIP